MFKKIMMVAAVLVIGAAAPAAAQYPSIVVNPGSTTPGGTVSVTGTYCEPGETVVIFLRPSANGAKAIPAEGIEVATVVANTDGTFNTSFVVPEGTEPGSYEVLFVCGGETYMQALEVLGTAITTPSTTPGSPTGPGGNSGSGNLPTTGSDLNGYGLVGAGLLTVGGLFLLGARKRRSTAVA